jgi:ABC-type polysaccharide/polyol phosphate export permease
MIHVVSGDGPRWTWLALPGVLMTQLIFSSACSILLACAGIYFREVGVLTSIFVQLWMYASPVVYGMERLSEPFRTVLIWTNPFAHVMPAYRQLLLLGEWPPLLPQLVILLISALMIAIGVFWLSRIRGRIYRYL